MTMNWNDARQTFNNSSSAQSQDRKSINSSNYYQGPNAEVAVVQKLNQSLPRNAGACARMCCIIIRAWISLVTFFFQEKKVTKHIYKTIVLNNKENIY